MIEILLYRCAWRKQCNASDDQPQRALFGSSTLWRPDHLEICRETLGGTEVGYYSSNSLRRGLYEAVDTARLIEHFSGLEALTIFSHKFRLEREPKFRAAIESQPQLRKQYVSVVEEPFKVEIATMRMGPLIKIAKSFPHLEWLVLDSSTIGSGHILGSGIEGVVESVSAH